VFRSIFVPIVATLGFVLSYFAALERRHPHIEHAEPAEPEKVTTA